MTVVKQKVNGHTYLYESKSYRNEEGKPRSKKTIIGKIDPATGNAIYKKEYLDRMKAAGTPIDQPQTETSYPESAVRNSKVKSYGAFYLYDQIAAKTGLLNILRDVFPEDWRQLLNIACYLLSSGEPVMYCGDWAEQTESYTETRMSPTAISGLFKSVSVGERNEFYSQWATYRCEQEYLALDITSVSSYSELINCVEWGYNRDKEKLAQVNLCLLMGEESGFPVFQTLYSGSLKDVSTLKTTLKLASSLSIDKMSIVMDKGFCSVKNIEAMFSSRQELRFLISVPFTLSFAKECVMDERQGIDSIENTLLIGEDVMRGVTRERFWNGKQAIFAHTYFNAIHAAYVKNDLYADIASIASNIRKGIPLGAADSKYKKFFRVGKPNKEGSGSEVEILNDEVEKALFSCGWLVIVSNHIGSAEETISVYRAKDVVEKGFLSMKGSLDLGRLRVHSDETVQSKVFVCFIALIIKCYIHRVMLSKGLYYKKKITNLLLSLDKLKVQYIVGDRILFPITKEQRGIYETFGVPLPV
jgi:hypothetical protein